MTLKNLFHKIKPYLIVPSPWDSVIVFFLNILISIPSFLYLHQNIIEFHWKFNLDRILMFIFLILVLQIIFYYVRKILVVGIFIYLIFLVYGTVFGTYTFERVYKDYNYMLYYMVNDAYPESVIISKLYVFPNKNKIKEAIEFQHPKVRNFALYATTLHFKDVKITSENRKIIHAFAVFKEIQSRWNYVHDPVGNEYYARASESLIHFSGDCDDHAIFVAACLRAVGCTPRLIHTKGHIYPELLIGGNKELEMINYIIREQLFNKQASQKSLHYHIDEDNRMWINMDYTAKYPGGPFFNEEVLGALTLE